MVAQGAPCTVTPAQSGGSVEEDVSPLDRHPTLETNSSEMQAMRDAPLEGAKREALRNTIVALRNTPSVADDNVLTPEKVRTPARGLDNKYGILWSLSAPELEILLQIEVRYSL